MEDDDQKAQQQENDTADYGTIYGRIEMQTSR